MTKYQQYPRPMFRPKKGTNKRKRQAMQKLLDAFYIQYAEKAAKVTSAQIIEAMIYGRSNVKVAWDEAADNQLQMTHEKQR